MKSSRSARQPFVPRRCKLSHSVFAACASLGANVVPVAVHAQAPSGVAPAAAASAPSASASGAVAGPAQTLQNVVVTARKREELLIEVPISMQVFSEKELRDSGTTDVQSLSSAAGFQLQQSTLGSTVGSGRTLGTFAFRGLQPSNGGPRDNSGALFLDGIFVSGGVSTVNTVGVQRVEVLKGPQNTYFGRNTFGGAVNFITKNPPTTFGGEVNTSFTGRGSSDVDATIGGPLGIPEARGSLTVFNHIKAAEYRATDGGALGAEKSTGITGTLYLEPTADLWLRLRGHYQQDDDSAAQLGFIRGDVNGVGSCTGKTYSGATNAGAPITYTPTVNYFCGTVPSSSAVGLGSVLNQNTALPSAVLGAFTANSLNDPNQSQTPNLDHSGLRRDTTRVSAQGAYNLPYDAQLAFSAGYNQSSTHSIWDLDRSVAANFLNSLQIVSDDVTLDTRLTSNAALPLRGLFGVSYFTSHYNLSQIDFNSGLGATAPTLNVSNSSHDKTKVPAIYGSVDYDILKTLTVSVEARYQRDTASTVARTTGVEYEKTFSNVLPRAILQFKPDADTNLYASWSKGVQPTSFNSGFVNATDAQKAYIASIASGAAIFTPQPSIRNLEAGIKQTLLQGRLQYAISAYQIDWTNQQTLSTVFNPNSCVAAGTFNTPACPLSSSGSFVLLPNNARIKGIEFSTLGLITPNWSAGLSLDYKDAKWKDYYDSSQSGFTGGATRFNGNSLTRVPKITGALNSTYTMPITGEWSGHVRGDVYYTAKSFADNENIAVISGYTRANLRIGANNKSTTIELFVKNLFDDKHWDSGYKLTDLAGSPLTSFTRQGIAVYAPDRREVGVTLRQTF